MNKAPCKIGRTLLSSLSFSFSNSFQLAWFPDQRGFKEPLHRPGQRAQVLCGREADGGNPVTATKICKSVD